MTPTKLRPMTCEPATADEFDCPDCGWHVYSLPPRVPPPTRCGLCLWLEEFVSDPAEREAIRERAS